MTSVALMMAMAGEPTWSPSRSTESVVITDPTRIPGAISTTSLLITSPRDTCTTRPGKRFVALSVPRSCRGARDRLDDLAFGVNWYLNPNTRVMLDYTLADLDPAGGGSSGDTKILDFRVQFNH